ncbi:hypothetical protein I350_01893 [Cryptococcus amylolentus CBS 6273]|nr:hypothetical protein I350_01893 [Cryptococcus amylolentus CBS 6273]
MSSYGMLSDNLTIQDQKRDIAELKTTSQYILSQVGTINSSLRKSPASSPHRDTIKINARVRDVLNVVLGRIETPLIRDSLSAQYARPILESIAKKYGELSEVDRANLARVIGRFEVTREYYTAGIEEKQSYRGPIFALCVEELRGLLGF